MMIDDIQKKDSNEKVEGLDTTESSLSDYPSDTLLIRNEPRTIHDVLRRIEKGSYTMNPDFQRDFIWTEDKQSKLIESVLMRIPLPVFYLAEDEQGRMIVVDGLQRLTTFQRFVNNQLRLRFHSKDEQGKKREHELENKRFQDLSPMFQNRIEDFSLILYLIDAKVPERARLDIFERVNSGVPLTRQQMRNSLYMGSGTHFLKEEANSSLFIDVTGRNLKTTSMRDREFVNRFCAFQLLTVEEYEGDMDDFLARTLKKMNKLSENDLKKLSNQLRTSLINNRKVFGERAFRKINQENDRRSVINASLWDVMSTGLSKYSENVVEARSDLLFSTFIELIKNTDFEKSITYATNDKIRVDKRFELAKAMFEGVFGANPN
jgi:hypothetical protein